MGRQVRDLTGHRFFRLVAENYRIERVGQSSPRNVVFWRCRCDCGNTIEVMASNLISGSVKSCKCWLRDRVTAANKATPFGRTHGGSGTPEHRAWMAMNRRCADRKQKGWRDYGGRGITACKRWRNSFEAFLADMGRKPSPKHSLERKNNDGSYSPRNCVWATNTEQKRNMRRNVLNSTLVRDVRLAKAAGESVMAWARRNRVPYQAALYAALRRTWEDVE